MMQCPWQPTWLLLPHFFAECPAAGLLVSLSIAVHGVMKRLYETRPGATLKIKAWKEKMLTVLNKDTKISSISNPGSFAVEKAMMKGTSLTASGRHYFDWVRMRMPLGGSSSMTSGTLSRGYKDCVNAGNIFGPFGKRLRFCYAWNFKKAVIINEGYAGLWWMLEWWLNCGRLWAAEARWEHNIAKKRPSPFKLLCWTSTSIYFSFINTSIFHLKLFLWPTEQI